MPRNAMLPGYVDRQGQAADTAFILCQCAEKKAMISAVCVQIAGVVIFCSRGKMSRSLSAREEETSQSRPVNAQLCVCIGNGMDCASEDVYQASFRQIAEWTLSFLSTSKTLADC